jgi:biotin operon repressor
MPLKKSAKQSTAIWGSALESGDFIKVPRALIRIHRYKDGLAGRLTPRHQMLLLVLATRRFKAKPLRAYWQELADDLGVSRETVRKWAYQLRDMKLLGISQVRKREKEDKRIRYRNEKTSSTFLHSYDLLKRQEQIATGRDRLAANEIRMQNGSETSRIVRS